MIAVATIFVCLLAIVVALFRPIIAWVIVAVPMAFFIWTFFSVRARKWAYVPSLSPHANELLQTYGHFYAMPFGASDFSSAASAVGVCGGGGVGVVCLIKREYWGIAVAGVVYVIMSLVAARLNPTRFLRPDDNAAHEEVVAYILSDENKR